MSDYLHVAVGVIVDANRHVLVSKRAPGSHQGGLWEFPGGKLEHGESVQQALQREIFEELDIKLNPSACFPFQKIEHHYADKSVLLDVWMITSFSGKPQGKEGQLIKWVPIQQLDCPSFPEANRSIIRSLQIPSQIGITGHASGDLDFAKQLETMLHNNIQLVQLRQPSLSDEEFMQRAEATRSLCELHEARFMVNSSIKVFEQTAADGLHLSSLLLSSLQSRPVPVNKLLSASCHNEQELDQAERIGVDFVLLSPVQKTASHPQSTAMGWDRFRELAASVSLPVYALGGIGPAQLSHALGEGAAGIAAISAYWGGGD